MFTPWIKRKSLKQAHKGKRLVVDGERPNMIALLSVSAMFVGVGVFVAQQSLAAVQRGMQAGLAGESGYEEVATTPSPTPTLAPTPTKSPIPTQGPSRREM